MSRELFSHDSTTGMSVYFDYDDMTDTATLEYTQDVEPLLEVNKQLQNDQDYTRHGMKSEMWHYASIPVGLQMKWLIEEGLDVYDDNAWPQILRKLNSPEYSYLKATHAQHSKQVFKGKPQLITP